jgi:hypothetical protein
MAGNRHHNSGRAALACASSDREHEEAVRRAEVKRLVHALAPYGVLHRDVLSREVAASNWHEPGFDRAIDAAVRQGQIEALPLGFYGLPHARGSRR